MAQKDAEKFIREIVKNDDLRTSLYDFDSSLEILAGIRKKGFEFKMYDFDQSISALKAISPTEEQAIMLDELQLWWNMLMLDGSITEREEPESCSPSKCSSCSSCG